MDKNITSLPQNDRPYEKLEKIGENNLTNSELLAIIIKTGTRKMSCLDIARKILKDNLDNMNELDYLSSLSIEQLKNYSGIGRVKAIQIKATLELAKRINTSYSNDKFKISSPEDVYKLVNHLYVNKNKEIVKTIILNNSNKVLSIVTNSLGSINKASVDIKDILSEPIKQMATGIILVHNHPSGNLTPSKEDIHLTNMINEYSKIFNIKLLDHIIIGKNKYVSLKEKGYL